jgi:hypothetical protein
LGRVLRRLLGKAHPLQKLMSFRLSSRAVAREHLQLGQRDVLGNRHVWEQLEILEHHADT